MLKRQPVTEFNALPKTRAEARSTGAAHYFTGVACKNGHIDKRVTSIGHCAECSRARQRVRLTDPVYREKHNRLTLKSRMGILADPERRKAIRAQEALAAQKSEPRKAKRAAADKLRQSGDDYRTQNKARFAVRYHAVLKHDLAYKAAVKAQGAKWARDNRGRMNAKTALRRSARLNATPRWLSAEMKNEMLSLYRKARSVSDSTSVKHEVDHIVPLQGESVSGLHVPWNLQILERTVNRMKSNRLDI